MRDSRSLKQGLSQEELVQSLLNLQEPKPRTGSKSHCVPLLGKLPLDFLPCFPMLLLFTLSTSSLLIPLLIRTHVTPVVTLVCQSHPSSFDHSIQAVFIMRVVTKFQIHTLGHNLIVCLEHVFKDDLIIWVQTHRPQYRHSYLCLVCDQE